MIVVCGILMLIIVGSIIRLVTDARCASSDASRQKGPTQSELNRINRDDKLKELISKIEHAGNLHSIHNPKPFVTQLMALDADIVLIGVNERRNGITRTSIILMKDGFIGSNCCKVVSFDKKLGQLEPYHLTVSRYVENITYKKSQSVVGSAIAGGMIAGDVGAIVGAAHAQNVNNNGGKTAHSYVPTEIYMLMPGGNLNPLTCLTYIAVKKSIVGDKFKELQTFPSGNDTFVLLTVRKCNKDQATQIASFFNNK